MSMKKMAGKRLEKAKRLREEGWAYAAISKDIGVALSAVRRSLSLRAKTLQENYERAHKKEKCIYDAAVYQGNKAVISSQRKEYYKDHRVEFRARGALYRALRAGAIAGNQAEVEEVYRRAKEETRVRCYLCGKLIPKGHRHVDHIIPLSKGGAHRPSNLAASCDKCNREKHDKLPGEIGVLL